MYEQRITKKRGYSFLRYGSFLLLLFNNVSLAIHSKPSVKKSSTGISHAEDSPWFAMMNNINPYAFSSELRGRVFALLSC